MTFKEEISRRERFSFGKNWESFLTVLDDERIVQAETALKEMLQVDSLAGKTFLDAGSGSGLSSLAARRLGAKVHSFDFDPESVKCTLKLRERYFPKDTSWTAEEGSVLNRSYLESLGGYDIVYSWGVLHHTGAMYVAFENIINCVVPGGTLFIAIYNDQGWKSHFWWFVKFIYNKLPGPLNTIYALSFSSLVRFLNLIKYTFKLKPMIAIRELYLYKKKRGMSLMHDTKDWMGGYPFEFATYNNLKLYFEGRGFELVRGKQASSLGCHEMIFGLSHNYSKKNSQETDECAA
ncbi:Class I SAM-dependent methyltransferase [Candidatus Electrothrix gigas]